MQYGNGPLVIIRAIREPAVLDRTGFGSKQHLRQQIAAGLFPRPIRIGPKAVAWVEGEVDAWLRARIADRGARIAAHAEPATIGGSGAGSPI
jgi:prophage regulatory protein